MLDRADLVIVIEVVSENAISNVVKYVFGCCRGITLASPDLQDIRNPLGGCWAGDETL